MIINSRLGVFHPHFTNQEVTVFFIPLTEYFLVMADEKSVQGTAAERGSFSIIGLWVELLCCSVLICAFRCCRLTGKLTHSWRAVTCEVVLSGKAARVENSPQLSARTIGERESIDSSLLYLVLHLACVCCHPGTEHGCCGGRHGRISYCGGGSCDSKSSSLSLSTSAFVPTVNS